MKDSSPPTAGASHTGRLLILVVLTMIAFAANSIVCRQALKATQIDPASFTLIRLVSGAATLWLIVRIRSSGSAPGGSWPAALSLFAYAAAFSFAYVSLSGRGSTRPIETTAVNFLRAAVFGALLSAVSLGVFAWDVRGALLAVLSGAVASGLGYAIWYTVLPSLRATHAATVQLSVPVIAAIGGVLLLGEHLSLRLVLCSVAILGGIGLVLNAPRVSRRVES